MRLEVELREIRVFLTLADELHFGRTADRLGIVPSRVSQTLRTFETRLGARLFDRTSRRVVLTPLGEQLEAKIGPSYEALIRGLTETREIATGVTGLLRIGFTPTTEGPELNELIQSFQSRYPSCRVEFHEVATLEPYHALRAGEVDVLVNWLSLDETDLIAGPAIANLPRVLAVARSHPLANADRVSLEQLGDEQVAQPPPSMPAALRDAVLPPRTPAGRPIPRTQPVNSTHEILAHVASGRIVHPTMAGLALMKRDDIALVPIGDLPPLPLGLIWPGDKETPKVRALAETANNLSP
jgi:DNA-binding transcriptional LysR family regulator